MLETNTGQSGVPISLDSRYVPKKKKTRLSLSRRERFTSGSWGVWHIVPIIVAIGAW